MKSWTFSALAGAIGAELHGAEGILDKEAGPVVMDSRKIRPGDVFLAFKGERSDGHDFIPQAMEKQAMGVICERPPEGDIPYLLVKDPLEALRKAASAYRDHLKIPVIAITGSVGKTSTKELCAAVLGAGFNVLKTEGNLNNDIGMPLTLLQINDRHQAAVLELGINHFGEMEALSAIARPDIVLISAIAECHLEALGDLEGVLKAKSEIFTHLQPGGKVLLNGDDPMLRKIKEVQGRPPLFYGLNGDMGERYISGAHDGHGGLRVTFPGGETVTVTVPFPGDHQMRNALGACGLGLLLGMSPERILAGLEQAVLPAGRGQLLELGPYRLRDDCYNANPASVRAGIDLLVREAGEEKARAVAVLGDMLELGDRERELHYSLGQYGAKAGLDALYAVGPLSAETVRGFSEAGGALCRHFASNEEFIRASGEVLRPGDRILLKASRGMHLEEILKALKGE